MLDYEILRLIWWALIGVLLIGFAVTDGFDMGVAALLRLAGKSDDERRVVINTVGPVWEGNQVWFITGGGAIFAAWPALYALSFSGFYLAMFLVLTAFIVRPVAFKYRSKRPDPRWRNAWDWALVYSGVIPPLIFGVAMGNVLLGVPFHYDSYLRPFYTGSFFALLNPFALLCGLVSLAMLAMHGAAYLNTKTTGDIAQRARTLGKLSAMAVIALFAVGGIWVGFIDGFVISSAMDTAGPSNPLRKEVVLEAGAWLNNYREHPWLLAAPFLGFAGAGVAFLGFVKAKQALTFIGSKLSVAGIISTVGVSMFPIILPSTSNPAHSLVVWDSSSSQYTLMVMLVGTIILLPIVLAYTAWAFKVMWGKVEVKDLTKDSY